MNYADERQNLVDDPAQDDRVKELKGQMQAWFKEYVIPDRAGIACDAGAGQNRPIGANYEDGTDAFVFATLGESKKFRR